ncbi:Rha family transcriptional regulator [Cupriavidus necator]|uniref:Rha family transcriptional regulator n=1 Tax=Cupriavidus necator TaxID=106590 RepID=UPI003ED0F0AD
MEISEIQDMVMLAGDKLVTDSRKVAEHFGKRHADVLRAVDRLECSPAFNQRNFASVEYLDGKGQCRRMVQMSKDGFMFLVMGFTGREAAAAKEAFIDAFNAMAEYIQTGQQGLWRQMQALIAQEVESKVRASFGSRLMLERKREIPVFRDRYDLLNAEIQPGLLPN